MIKIKIKLCRSVYPKERSNRYGFSKEEKQILKTEDEAFQE